MRLRAKCVFVAFVFLLGCKKPLSDSPVRIGDYPADVREKLGPATHLSNDKRDVFIRQIKGKEFMYFVAMQPDDVQSQLHPSMRVFAEMIRPDAHVGWRLLLNTLPETRDLCRAGCNVVANYDFNIPAESYGIYAEAEMQACPVVPPGDSGWPKEPLRTPGTSLCIEMSMVPLTTESKHRIDWDALEVKDVELVYDEPIRTSSPWKQEFDRLGVWKPS